MKTKLTKRNKNKEIKKDKILNFLDDVIIASTGKIASKIKADKYRAIELLEELLKEKKVRMIKMPNATFWELK